MSTKTKDILLRALKTFWQSAIAYILSAISGVNFFNGDMTKTVITGILVSALASGLSAVWNGIISPLLDNKKQP